MSATPLTDKRRFFVINTGKCFMPMGHYDGCLCEHGIECRVYRVEADGREHYATRPVCAVGGLYGADALSEEHEALTLITRGRR